MPRSGGGGQPGHSKLANAFVCTANIEASDGGAAIVDGNRKVLAARLSDARFFWEQDRRKTLAQHAEGLKRITFHEKLGTVADKVERVAKLAEWLASEGIVPGCDPALARRAAELCKADLVTEMVGEFPELQGVMGGYYARAKGLPHAVADAIRDHYKPVGQGDEVPTAPVTVAVALADKLDNILCFFAIGQRPTGSKDPFALRRAAIGLIETIRKNALPLPIRRVIRENQRVVQYAICRGDLGAHHVGYHNAVTRAFPDITGRSEVQYDAIVDDGGAGYDQMVKEIASAVVVSDYEVTEFLADRLKVQQREAGVRHDLIDAVFALGGEDDLVRLLARVHALQAFVGTADGANLLAGYKRAANILKKEGFASPRHPGFNPGSSLGALSEQGSGTPDQVRGDDAVEGGLGYTPEPAEAALVAALDAAEPRAETALAAEDFTGAMAALATLRAPIDAFFEEVTVNDPDPARRAARLALLDRFRAAVHKVADFSRIEG